MAMQTNEAGMVIKALIQKKAYDEKIPVQAAFELTPRCGLNCRMCYVHLPDEKISQTGRGRELTGDEWLHIGCQAVEMGVLSLCITGGDPILHPEFKKIWTGLSEMGFRLTLQTNAACLTKEVLSVLEAYPPELAKITLYGSNDQVYRDVCGIEHGFTRTKAGIEALQTLDIPIQLVTTFIRQNRDDAQNIVNFAGNHQLPWYYSTACYPSLRGADSQAKTCALDVWTLGCEKDTARLWKHLPSIPDERLPGANCSGYRTSFNISWDGYMRFCLFLNEPDISVIDQPLDQCWQQLLCFWDSIRWPEQCYTCPDRAVCRRCVAHLACLNGGIGKVSEDYCMKVRKILAVHQD